MSYLIIDWYTTGNKIYYKKMLDCIGDDSSKQPKEEAHVIVSEIVSMMALITTGLAGRENRTRLSIMAGKLVPMAEEASSTSN